jgi:hypothetical protein
MLVDPAEVSYGSSEFLHVLDVQSLLLILEEFLVRLYCEYYYTSFFQIRVNFQSNSSFLCQVALTVR